MTTKKFNFSIDPEDFSRIFHKNLELNNLLELFEIINKNNKFFFRGYIKVRKKWLNAIGQYVCLYLVFGFTINGDELEVESNWFEGDSNYPISSIANHPKISKEYKSLEKSLHDKIESIVKKLETI
jgi:hypothetical protein